MNAANENLNDKELAVLEYVEKVSLQIVSLIEKAGINPVVAPVATAAAAAGLLTNLRKKVGVEQAQSTAEITRAALLAAAKEVAGEIEDLG